MNSLMNYGSDDDDSPEERSMDSYGMTGRSYRKPAGGGGPPQDDTNYDEVQMSLSEDSDAESKSPSKHNRDREERRHSPKSRESRDNPQRDRERRDERSERDRYAARDRNEDRTRKDRDDERTDKTRNRDEKDDRTRSRDDDRNRDKYRDKDDDRRDRRDDRRPRSRDRYNSRDDKHKQDRDRRRSRSPRDNRDRERRRSRSPRRSRSRSRERSTRGGYQRRFDRGINRMDKNDLKGGTNSTAAAQNEEAQNKDRFFMPGITGRFRDQIEKRKLLWQKKEPENVTAPPRAAIVAARSVPVHNPNAPRATKVWESTTFAQDTDGKVANKFKRLMGIRTPSEGANPAGEVLKKQDEMFSAMEQQYEVARTTTHTMRGVGLGFSSFNR